jgi:bacillolysin
MQKIYTILALVCLSINAFTQKEKRESNNDTPTFIEFSASDNKQASMAKHVIKEALKASNNNEFKEYKSENDQIGFTHSRHQQYFKNTKVEFGTYVSHSRNGKVESLSGDYKKVDDNFDIRASLSESTALLAALNTVNAAEYMWDTEDAADYYKKVKGKFQPEGELVLIENFQGNTPDEKNQIRLAWKFDIYATSPLSRAHVYVDAKNGEHIFSNAIIHHVTTVPGTFATRYSGTQIGNTEQVSSTSYRLRDATRGLGVNTYNLKKGTRYNRAVDFTDTNNQWTEYANATKDNAALDAHFGAQNTYDYFKNVHVRNSYNNAGAAINSYVHYSSNYVNAYWDGTRMTYGDGNGTSFDPLTSQDVCSHEIGHAVCETSANLVYQKESGAMNEALSDIWGACVEYYKFPTKGTWLVGEDFDLAAHQGFRSMSNPNLHTDPDTYGGTYWINPNCTPSSNNDYCGVHTNSGVLNFMFYLLTIGGTGTNDVSNSYTVTGLGITDASRIIYRMETVYMTSTSTYATARTAAIQAATDLFGATSQQVRSITNAFYAVGVGAAHPNGARIGLPVENIVTTKNNDEIQVTTFPNPSQDFVQIKLNGEQDSNIEVMITDEMGRVRFEKFSNLNTGENNINIDVKKLPVGKYNLRAVKTLKDGSSKITSKALILGN